MKTPLPTSNPTHATRRQALERLAQLTALVAAPALGGCGGVSEPAPPAPGTTPPPATNPPASPAPPTPTPPPPPAPTGTPLSRLKAALQRPPLGTSANALKVTQTRDGTAGAPTTWPSALIYPVPRGAGVNPNPASLADMPQVWGHQRGLWTRQTAGLVGTAAGNTSWFVPVSRDHVAATLSSRGACALHFRLDGSAFEVLFAGTNVEATLIADGHYTSARFITTTLAAGQPGAPLNQPNAYVRFDFGRRAVREVSLYARSSQGPCALALDNGGGVTAWDRSAEPAIAVLADSYGSAPSPNWGINGPFWEAAALLGVPNMDIDAIGGTGYAPNNANSDTRNPGNAFAARVASSVAAVPDLMLVAGGINDNNALAAPPLYATAAEARDNFARQVQACFTALRAALPQAVLAATGPWAPRENVPPDPVALSKADTVRAALQATAGPWVFMDNLRGTWLNSRGTRGGAPGADAGPWQTGTGRAGAPSGSGNGDRWLDNGGVHPNEAGSLGLGGRIATDLRAALQDL